MSGPLGPVGPMSTLHAQRRVAHQMDACRRGDCRYRDATRTRQQCQADLDATCDGYEAHVYLEDGAPVLRWRRCERFRRTWWPAEKERIAIERRRRQQRQREERGGTPRRFTEDDQT